jgi:hypothetical protein
MIVYALTRRAFGDWAAGDWIAARPGVGVTGPVVDDLARWARALTAETPTGALHHLEQMATPMTRLAALDRIETAVRAERADLARDWSAELDRFGTATESGWARAAAAYGRALLSDDAHAPEQFEQAIQHAGTAARRFDRARIHLGYGEYLRRARRRVDARAHLRNVFSKLGLSSRAELAALQLG